GCAAVRVNPGNIRAFDDQVREIARAAGDRGTSIRIGVNAGSLDKRLLAKHGKATPEALVESALWEASLFEEHGFRDFKISVKHNDPVVMVRAYELLSESCDYPLHLGVTEAGLFPGVILFLSEWFPNKHRVQMFAIFYLAQPFSQMLGAPLSGGLISFGEQLTPWAGWQVMFFVEGMMAVVAGIAAIFLLIDSPQKAKWLNQDEKDALITVMAKEDSVRESDGPSGIWRAMGNWKVWYFTIIYFCLQIAVYG
ncbi:flavodoxin-dependent (E)-4-hydroxy-3-methylbut-2-enyl-diphosphate synthase, partial [Bradyrhizobium sp. NBAIM08]|nr:flavodoxin-dependent (E)-4-hydroxy-3-methylbut-2-enyl-diphosphate synthase [Bradyrhizobium sp. NBAIM08]